MTTEEILALVKAGYTAAEISAMQTPADPADPDPETPPADPADPDPETPPADPAEPDMMTRTEVTALFGSLQKSIADLTKAVQTANAKAARSPDPNAGKLSVENVVADFFGGPSGKKGG